MCVDIRRSSTTCERESFRAFAIRSRRSRASSLNVMPIGFRLLASFGVLYHFDSFGLLGIVAHFSNRVILDAALGPAARAGPVCGARPFAVTPMADDYFA